MKTSNIIILIFSFSFICSCNTVKTVKRMGKNWNPPLISVAGSSINKKTDINSELSLYIRLENENEKPITITGGTYNVTIQGIRLQKGTTTQDVKIPSEGSSFYNVKIPLLANQVIELEPIILTPGYSYKVKAVLEADLGDDHFKKFKTQHQGVVNFYTKKFRRKPSYNHTRRSTEIPSGMRMVPAITIPQ